ncbi:citrate synthase [Raphidocelis subcapitata]|uniref:Citrate synthase n=1 Tax=Raphidocelis subcapitata TaxID=307507 RepID=A0A2V0P090_9CHLO|nr:citrate synthase [Raphidocelis subcapitata]|eukprot:GBF91260.1 citrate synthase [Raphidocelis subcapitata]
MASTANSRLSVLSRQLSALAVDEDQLQRQATKADESVRPAPGGGRGTLTVVDNRSGKKYTIEITEGGTIPAAALKKITAGGDGVGLRTYDPGYTNTSAVISRISYIDGDRGILRYRGFPIEELAEQNYFEVAFLVLYGDLPSRPQLALFTDAVMRHCALPSSVEAVVAALPHDTHPMAVLLTGLAALSGAHPEQNPALAGEGVYKSRAVQDKQIARLVGKISTLAALAYHKSTGRVATRPNQRLGFAENFLFMLDANGVPNYRPNPRLSRALEIMFVLHMEHEMNCSTAAARHLASSGVDVYTAIAGAVGALYGPLHGGANEAVLRMLARIGSADNIPAFIEGVKAKREKLFGFGHRVYKNFDPRAVIIRKDYALADEYFVSRKLYPNVDFYSGLVYRAMGFPPQFFTVLFAIPRVVGYCAHWRESLVDPDTKIIRPQQDYRGVWLRHYEPLAARAAGAGDAAPAAADAPAALPESNAYQRRVAGENWHVHLIAARMRCRPLDSSGGSSTAAAAAAAAAQQQQQQQQ